MGWSQSRRRQWLWATVFGVAVGGGEGGVRGWWAWLWATAGAGDRPAACMRCNEWHLINVLNTVPISLPDIKLVKVIFIQLV